MQADEVNILIPNYNGYALLQKYLPSVVNYYNQKQILIVDDASTDSSVEYIKNTYPYIRLIIKEKNSGFSETVNIGLKEICTDFVLLLNNDIELKSDIITQLLPCFEDKTLFAVSPKIILPSKDNIDEACKSGFWHHGMFYCSQEQGITQISSILYATGCSVLMRKSMLDKLGGFDTAYSPFYWEDADLGYRAWQRGWKSYYNPNVLVIHQHAGTIASFNKNYTNRIKFRNSLLFIWRNVTDTDIMASHQKWLSLVILKKLFTGDFASVFGWLEALRYRKAAAEHRCMNSQYRVLEDKEIFKQTRIE
jgi:GT2 family glycosyltransferase